MKGIPLIARPLSRRIGKYFTIQAVDETVQDFGEEYRRAGLDLHLLDYLSLTLVCTYLVAMLTFGEVLLLTRDGLLAIFLSIVTGFLLGTMFVLYPLERAEFRSRRIARELPPALEYMAAMIGASNTPVAAFEMIAKVEQYEEMSNIAKRISQRVNDMGMALNDALDCEVLITPSQKLNDVLKSLKSEIISGGDITQFFEEKSKASMEDYVRVQQGFEKYMDTLSTIYSTVFLLAPLLFVIMIIVLSFVGGGEIAGIPVPDALNIGSFLIIPLLNIMFIVLVKTIQPEGM